MSRITPLDPTFADTGFWAIIALIGWLVPNLYVLIAEAQWELQCSPHWKSTTTTTDQENNGRPNNNNNTLSQGLQAITRQSILMIVLCTLCIIASAVGVALGTKTMDVNMLYVLSGIARLAAAVIVLIVSIRIPRWFGVYVTYKDDFEEPIGDTLKVVRFNIRWKVFRHFFQIFFVLLPFYSGVYLDPPYESYPGSITVAFLVGIFAGGCVAALIYFGRSTRFKAYKRSISLSTAFVLIVLSSFSFGGGIWYIQSVWDTNAGPDNMNIGYGVSVVAWFVACMLLHWLVWSLARKRAEQQEALRSKGDKVQSVRYKTALFHPQYFAEISRENDNLAGIAEEDSGVESGDPVQDMGSTSGENKDVTEKEESMVEKAKDTSDVKQPEDVPQDDENEKSDKSEGDEAENTTGIIPEQTSSSSDQQEDKDEDESEEVEPSCCSLFMGKCCCSCCVCCGHSGYIAGGGPARKRTGCEKFYQVFKWFIWTLASLACIYVTLVNIGASQQAGATRAALPEAQRQLYTGFNEGEVCAFRNNTGPVRTFANATVAEAANYTVLHCGACGACSTWDIVHIQWTTRHELASLAKVCATKTIFSFDAALQCHIDTIGFDYDCSLCWTRDEVCTRNHCVFIYLQSLIINTFTNFAVNNETITSAVCEEAFCELENGPGSGEMGFVECSGATRRRMNIKSDIERPAWQECHVAAGPTKWEQLWGP